MLFHSFHKQVKVICNYQVQVFKHCTGCCEKLILHVNNNCIERHNLRFFTQFDIFYTIWDFLQSPHCATNHLQHVHSSGPSSFLCKSYATHQEFIMCRKKCRQLTYCAFSTCACSSVCISVWWKTAQSWSASVCMWTSVFTHHQKMCCKSKW